MYAISRYIYNATASLFGSSDNSAVTTSTASTMSDSPIAVPSYDGSTPYEPSIDDVLRVKDILLSLPRPSPLPIELIDAIIDHAEYWPHTTSSLNSTTFVRSGTPFENRFILRSFPLGFVPGTHDFLLESKAEYARSYNTWRPIPWPETREFPHGATEEVLHILASGSLPRGESPCRKIVFTIKSHDQGWGGAPGHHGTYKGSFTWFDVGLERMSASSDAELGSYLDDESQKRGVTPNEPVEIQTDGNRLVCTPQPAFRISAEALNVSHDASVQQRDEQILTNPLPYSCNFQTLLPMTVTDEATDTTTPYRFHHDLLPGPTVLQRNVTAKGNSTEHTITWSCNDYVHPESLEGDALEEEGRGRASANGEYMRDLKIGDAVTVWGKARFPGWSNTVEEMKIDVYWAV